MDESQNFPVDPVVLRDKLFEDIVLSCVQGQKISLIKAYREFQTSGLKEAKDFVEKLVPDTVFSRIRDGLTRDSLQEKRIAELKAEVTTLKDQLVCENDRSSRLAGELDELSSVASDLREDLEFYTKRAALVSHYQEVLKHLLGGKD